jgi:D-sedoheptulose 7-phosphate isomerase
MFNLRVYLDDYVRVLQRPDWPSIEQVADVILRAWHEQRTVFLCGNGGSAASASHIAADLTKLTAPAFGPRLRAVSMTESTSALSAIANDVAYEQVFAEQLRAFCQPGDVVIGLSTSGASPNVLRAIEFANSIHATTVGITGAEGKKLTQIVKHPIVISSTSVQHIEDATMVLGHILCLRVRESICLLNEGRPRRPFAAAAGVANVLPLRTATAP